MPKITLRQPYATYRGRDSAILGNVLYPQGGRMFARSFVQPSNPNSAKQVQARAWLTQASQAYSSVTVSEAAAWAALSAQLLRTDDDGIQYDIGAKGMYTQVNYYRLLDGQAVTDVAPVAATAAAPTGITSLTDDATPSNILIFPHANADGFFLVEWTRPLPGVRRQPQDSDFIIPATDPSNCFLTRSGATETLDLADGDNDILLAAGDRVGVRITALSAGYIKGQTYEEVVTVA